MKIQTTQYSVFISEVFTKWAVKLLALYDIPPIQFRNEIFRGMFRILSSP